MARTVFNALLQGEQLVWEYTHSISAPNTLVWPTIFLLTNLFFFISQVPMNENEAGYTFLVSDPAGRFVGINTSSSASPSLYPSMRNAHVLVKTAVATVSGEGIRASLL